MLPREEGPDTTPNAERRVLARRSDSHRNFLGKEKENRWHQLRTVEGTRDAQGEDGAQWLHPLSVGGRNPLAAGEWVLQCPFQLLGLLGEGAAGFLQEEPSATCSPLLLQYNPNLSAFRAC